MMRATTSLGPPAAKETIQCTGRDGYVCADARRERAGSATAPAAHKRSLVHQIASPPTASAPPITIIGSSARPSRQLDDEATSTTRRRGRDITPHVIRF